ncbi:Acetyltransferase [Sulfitobacter noctilucae]|uniref:GNAT family N-acetyltransferase n=1 Tax=Sulfitobacter noctilucae TaxID=1342302 RepID=UPI000467FC16|nr:GNAT family N-acetyltransferase [Sulfitobacter noctilucae]KIN75202.1 Acetyltransferase [Sulfitobacter noctilucae]
MALTLRRLGPDDTALADALALIRTSFAYMDGVIDPPSSMHSLTLDALRDLAETQEIWTFGSPLIACAIFTVKANLLTVGKLAVAPQARGTGLARQLLTQANARAYTHGLSRIELQSRVELTGNHAAFTRLGFREVARTTHPGFDRPTSITFQRKTTPPAP